MRIAEFGLVDMLAAGTARAQRIDLEIDLVDHDVDVLRLGQHRDGCGRGMDAARRLGVGHALHAVHAGFELELRECAAAADFGDDFLEAAHRTFIRRDDLDLPALLGGVALVHAEQVAGEHRRLVAAGAGADFKDDVALVHRVLGQQRETKLLLQRRAARLQLRLLGFGDGAHLGIGRRVREQVRKAVELALRGAIGIDRLDHRLEVGKFARQLYESLGRQRARKLALHRRMACNQGVQFLFRQHRALAVMPGLDPGIHVLRQIK